MVTQAYIFSYINSYDNIEANSIAGGGMATAIFHK